MARQFGPSYADAVTRASVPFLWLCGPSGVGKSAVGYEIFQQIYRSGIKASFMDFDQFGLCYPSPADDPDNHHVKAQNLAAVWPTYRAAGARCLIAVGGVTSRETVLLYAGKVPDTNRTLCRLRATPERLTERVFRRGLGPGPADTRASTDDIQAAARGDGSRSHPRSWRTGRCRLRGPMHRHGQPQRRAGR